MCPFLIKMHCRHTLSMLPIRLWGTEMGSRNQTLVNAHITILEEDLKQQHGCQKIPKHAPTNGFQSRNAANQSILFKL